MLDHVGGMADNTGKNQLVVWKFHVLPDLSLMLVANVAGFK
jgi:hypothetical protein